MNTRIVIDTNVFISSVVGKFGFPRKIVDEMVLTGRFKICFSQATFGEVIKVSNYPRLLKKHPYLREGIFGLMENLKKEALFVKPEKRLSIIKDESDNRFLEAAVAAKAGFLVTGNTNDFTFDEYEGIQIMTPRTFYELFSTEK